MHCREGKRGIYCAQGRCAHFFYLEVGSCYFLVWTDCYCGLHLPREAQSFSEGTDNKMAHLVPLVNEFVLLNACFEFFLRFSIDIPRRNIQEPQISHPEGSAGLSPLPFFSPLKLSYSRVQKALYVQKFSSLTQKKMGISWEDSVPLLQPRDPARSQGSPCPPPGSCATSSPPGPGPCAPR